MLLMIKRGISGGICHSIYQYEKANNKYMEDYDKNKELSYIQCWDMNSFYGWAMSQNLPINTFECIKDASSFNEDSMRSYNEESD